MALDFIPIICGPTASGKSALALELCKKIDGELVSCDSMQIYKHLDVGTAKPTPEEQQAVRHHLIDIVEPGVNFSVNDYLEACFAAIEDIKSREKTPVICGGTGQYISALKDGIRYDDKVVPESVTEALYERYDHDGIDGIYDELVRIDPDAASKIHKNNTRRVIRAYSVYVATGRSFTKWNSTSKKSGPKYPFKLYEYDYEPCRDVLYDRINRRVDVMVEQGLVEEALYLYSLDIPRPSTCFQAIGYKEFKDYVEHRTPEALERAIYKIKLNSRHYAKRQLTWFRYIDDIVKIPADADTDSAVGYIN